MTEPFIITVTYKGEERNFEAQLQASGYTHRFLVVVEEMDVFFEWDEEGHYRAVIPPAHLTNAKKHIDPALLQTIAAAMEAARGLHVP